MTKETAVVVDPAVVAAAITAVIAVFSLAVNHVVKTVRENRDRRREVFAKAFAATVAYSEFPYVVRRRKTSDPEEERVRISTELMKIQEDLSYYSAWMESESRKVAERFSVLVAETRRIAGGQIHNAWRDQPVLADEQMNMPDLGMGELKPARDAYLASVRRNLAPIKSRLEN
jgi:hypothetical protein